MGSFLDDSLALEELRKHHEKYEGIKPYFYHDTEGLITIGLGEKVSSLSDARKFARDAIANGWEFRRKVKGVIRVATRQDIIGDWKRRNRGQKTLWRLTKDAVIEINENTVEKYARQMFGHKKVGAIARILDEYIQLAIIDVRYNPAGVAIYGFRRLWRALDKSKNTYNLSVALEIFEAKWANRAKKQPRYKLRHADRVNWFKLGVQRTMVQEALLPPPIDPSIKGTPHR